MKPIAMRCSQEQYEEIKPLLLQNGFNESRNRIFTINTFLVNNYDGTKKNLGFTDLKNEYDRESFETWNKNIFLEYCGITEWKLPEKWCVKDCQEVTNYARNRFNKDILTIISNKKYLCVDENKNDYWFLIKNHFSDNYNVNQQDFVELSIEQFKTHVLKQNTKTMQTLTLGQLKDLYSVSDCSKWRENINYYLSTYLQRKDDFKVVIKSEHIQLLLKEGTLQQQTTVEKLGIKLGFPIEWDKIKTGSKVMLDLDNREKIGTRNNTDGNKPFDVVFWKTKHYINCSNEFRKEGSYSLIATFHQNGKYVAFDTGVNTDYITEVIEY